MAEKRNCLMTGYFSIVEAARNVGRAPRAVRERISEIVPLRPGRGGAG